jgi:hypothetical protein
MHFRAFLGTQSDLCLNRAGDQKGVQKGDYFVPWHIPLHRVEAAAAAARTLAAPHAGSAEGSGAQTTLGGLTEDACSPALSDSKDVSRSSDAGSSMAADAQIHTGAGSAGEGGFADGRVDRAKGTVVFKRYYHLFYEGELDLLILQVPGVRITDSFYDKSNWCVVYQRDSQQ